MLSTFLNGLDRLFLRQSRKILQQFEIKNALDQTSAPLLLRACNESCRIFLDYLKKIPSSPFKSIDIIFAIHEFQSTVVNIPHINAMLKVKWDKFSQEEKKCVNECIHASVIDIIIIEEVQSHIEKGSSIILLIFRSSKTQQFTSYHTNVTQDSL